MSTPGQLTPARPTSRTPRTLTTTAGLTLALVVSGCSALGGGTTTENTATGSSPGSSTNRSSTSGAAASALERDPALDSTTPVATRTATFEAVDVRFDVLGLRRSGSLATLRFTATNTTPGDPEDSDHQWYVDTDLGARPGDYSVAGVYLVDPVNSTKYPVASDPAEDCVCSTTNGVKIVPTQGREFSATFAAPPEQVGTVDVTIPGAGTLENIPVS